MLFVNVDASFSEDGDVGVGWHIRKWSDTAGQLYDDIERGGKSISEGNTSEKAEYLACIHGVERALRHGNSEITISTDCKNLVQKINTGGRLRKDGRFRDRLYRALEKFDSWRIKWIPRSSNEIAHKEANAARKQRNLYQQGRQTRGNESCTIG